MDNNQEYISCPECGEEITSDSEFCPHCGILFEGDEEVYCEYHPEREAGGLCIICRILLCKECAVNVHGRLFCVEHSTLEVQQDWVNVFESDDPIQANLVCTTLKEVGVQALPQNIPFVSSGPLLVDEPVLRMMSGKKAKVFVPIPLYLQALDALEDWEKQNE